MFSVSFPGKSKMKYYAYRELKVLSTTAFMLAFIYEDDN